MATTMQSYQSKKQVLLNVLEQTAKVAEIRRSGENTAELRTEAEHLRKGELNVVVCGECKRGKSSLINAFLEEPELCPTDAPIATNVITVIKYAEREKILVHLLDAKENVTTEEIVRAQIREYATEQGNLRNKRRVQLIEIWLSNPKLKDGLVLMDTPGVGSLNTEHTAATYSIIPYADAVIFVGEAKEVLTTPELEFCERIVKHTRHVLHVVTKRDSAANPGQILKDNLMKLRTILKGEVKGAAVSSTMKMEYLKDRDEEALALSGFAELEKMMWEMLSQRSGILLGRAQGKVLPLIAQMLLPLQAEQAALSSTSGEELKEIEEELDEMIRRADELSSGSATWQSELNRRMTILQTMANKWMLDEFAEIHHKLGEYLKVDDYVAEPKMLGDMLIVDCNNVFATVISQVEVELNHITDDLRRLTSLRNIRGGRATASGAVGINLAGGTEGRRESFLFKASTVGRSFTLHSMGLAAVGGIAGGIIGGIVGTLAIPGLGTVGGASLGSQFGAGLAGGIGAIFGLKRGISDLKEKELSALRQSIGTKCREQLANVQRTLTYELNVLLTNARAEIQSSLQQEIHSEQKACREAAAALTKGLKEKQSDASGRLRQLNNDIKFLSGLSETASKVTDEAAPIPAMARA